mmetsp:Transcript_45688/g.54963  ORF Transcript_45688/g.54963 Transcript_45688/m.54963 type:complete len:114 (+) Transcript_45688:1681-2022(+)
MSCPMASIKGTKNAKMPTIPSKPLIILLINSSKKKAARARLPKNARILSRLWLMRLPRVACNIHDGCNSNGPNVMHSVRAITRKNGEVKRLSTLLDTLTASSIFNISRGFARV